MAFRIAAVEEGINEGASAAVVDSPDISTSHAFTMGCVRVGLHLQDSKSSSCLWNAGVGSKRGRAKITRVST